MFKALMQWPNGMTARRTGTLFIRAALAQGAVILPDPANNLPPEWQPKPQADGNAQEDSSQGQAQGEAAQAEIPRRGKRRRIHAGR